MMKRTLAFLLTLVLMVGMLPLPVQAEEPQATVDNGDVTIEGSNGFGTLLSQEITESQSESAVEASDYEAGYAVTDLTIEGDLATVEYSSLEDAMLVVALYSEDGMQMLASGQVKVSADEDLAYVSIEGELPEYFLASAYLMDTYDLSPLCPAYDTPMYTQEMQELLASTIHDYDADRVLNLDEDETTNFAVYAEDTIVIEGGEGVNTVVSVDDEYYTYVIENADEQITSLTEGDVFVYSYGEDEMLIVKVASIEVNGTTVTITGSDELEMEEVFDFAKIEGSTNSNDLTIDDSTAGEGVTYVGDAEPQNAASGVMTPLGVEEGNTGVSTELVAKVFNLGITDEGDNHKLKVTGSVGLKISMSLKFYITKSLQRVEFKITGGLEGSIEVESQLSAEIPLCTVVGKLCGVVDCEFKVELIVSLTGKAQISFGFELMAGFAFQHDKEGFSFQKLYKTAEPVVKTEFVGELYFGLEFTPVLELLNSVVWRGEVDFEAGLELKSSLSISADTLLNDERHDCVTCYDGDVSFVFRVLPKMKFFMCDSLYFEGDIGEFKVKWLDVYICPEHNVYWGWGECPERAYKLTVHVVDENKQPVAGAAVGVDGTTESTNEKGIVVFWVKKGKHQIKATASIDGKELISSYSINVSEGRKEYITLWEEYDPDKHPDSGDSGNDSDATIDFGGIRGTIEDEAVDDSTNWYDDVEFDGGTGSKEDPYLISTPAQLFAMHNDLEASYKLRADIDLSGYEDWKPVGGAYTPITLNSEEEFEVALMVYDGIYRLTGKQSNLSWDLSEVYGIEEGVTRYYALEYFEGQFDGNGHTISNVRIDNPVNYTCIGFFGIVSDSIFNLNLENIDYDITDFSKFRYGMYSTDVGGIVGSTYGHSIIVNCTVSGTINVSSTDAPDGLSVGGIAGNGRNGLAGYSLACVGCINYASIQGVNKSLWKSADGKNFWYDCMVYCGGIIGYGSAVYCSNYGAIYAKSCEDTTAGGIAGVGDGVSYSINFGEVTCVNQAKQDETDVASAFGIGNETLSSSFYGCVNYGNVSAESLHSIADFDEEDYSPPVANASGINVESAHYSYNLCDTITARREGEGGRMISNNTDEGISIGRIGAGEFNLEENYSLDTTTINGSTISDGGDPYGKNGGSITAEEALNSETYAAWEEDLEVDFDTIWRIDQNWGGPVLRDAEVLQYGAWSASSAAAYFTEDGEAIVMYVTNETENAFQDNPEEYLGLYVWVTSKTNEAGQKILIDMKPLEVVIGTVTHTDTFEIDYEWYDILYDADVPDNLLNHYVCAYIYDGYVVEIEDLYEEGSAVVSGECGDNAIWEWDGYNVLTISGTGEVTVPNYDWTYAGNTIYANATQVVIDEGITALGEEIFYGCIVREISLPDSLISIGDGVFAGSELEKIVLPANVEVIGSDAFADCYYLKMVVFTGDAPEIDEYAFWSTEVTAYYPSGNATWTDEVKQDYEGTITWIPYTSDENIIDMESVHIEAMKQDTPALFAVSGGEYSTEEIDSYTLKTASFKNLVPGEQYVLLAMASIEVDNPLAADNLLYIDQAVAQEDGTLSFRYVQRIPMDVSYVVACGASNNNLADAEITFPEMTADGELQAVNPAVVYDGKTLTEGRDYTIVGTVSFTEAGTYTCYIRGIHNYTGLVECVYTIAEGQTHTPGDINDDGKVNNKDLTRLFQYLSNWEVEVVDEALDVNGDGKVNNKDLTRLFQYLSNWDVEIF